MTERKLELILGPCSVHSAEQLRETALSLNHGRFPEMVSMRANLVKPTTEYRWTGMGNEGVQIIADVKRESNVRISMEVTTPKDLEYMLEVSDNLWLGAKRQPNNTEAVVRELRNVDLGMFLVKNPWAYDTREWCETIGLVRKNLKSSVKVVGLFRGFRERNVYVSPEGKTWRYNPDLEAVHEVAHKTGVDMWIDYSHLIGETSLIFQYLLTHRPPEIFKGAMLEVDARPWEAKTDKKQVLSPKQARQIIKHWRENDQKFKVGII